MKTTTDFYSLMRYSSLLLLLLFVLGSCTESGKSPGKKLVLKEKPIDAKEGKAVSNELVELRKALKTGSIEGDKGALDRGSSGYVLVYVPALNDKNTFDHKLHGAGMFTYFENQPKKLVETILVSKQPKKVFDAYVAETKKEQPEVYRSMTMIHDADKSILKALEIDEDHLAHGGVAITFDGNGKQLFEQEDYKCQGEKLLRMHQHFYPRTLDLPKTNYELKVGQKAPEDLKKYIGEHLGKKNLLVTFYPAPLSHSCSIQMATLGEFAVQNKDSKDLKTIAISIGSEQEVDAWKLNQNIKGIEMEADVDGSISNAFNSLLTDEYGITYSDRTVFLIDKKGIVRYINEDYDVGADLDVLEAEIKKL